MYDYLCSSQQRTDDSRKHGGLHWFDKYFHRKDGPAQFAKAKLVRYADDFVVLARYQGPKLIAWVENTLENWLGLVINRDKTRVVNLHFVRMR